MTDIGDVNNDKQKLLAMNELKSDDHERKIWILECVYEDCGHVYRTNGGEFHERKCPKCQGGEPGL